MIPERREDMINNQELVHDKHRETILLNTPLYKYFD